MNFQDLYDKAHDHGWEAGHEDEPVSVTWMNEHTGKKYAPCTEGLCGFAWIEIYNEVPPGKKRKVKTDFAKWLIAEGLARWDDYRKCTMVWVRDFNQSHSRKIAYAEAFSEVLRDAGYKAYMGERLD